MRTAVIDLGSSSFTLLVATVEGPNDLRQEVKQRIALRLGMYLGEGRIPDPEVEPAVQAAQSLHRRALQAHVDRTVVVATETLRHAVNGSQLVGRIAAAIGEPVSLLSGLEEARLAFLGARAGLALDLDIPTLVLDLGGGSLELATGNGQRANWAASVDVGVLRLMGELVDHDPPTPAEQRSLRSAVRRRIRLPARQIPEACTVVGTGGTVRGLARLARARRDGELSLNGMTVSRPELKDLERLLLEIPSNGRAGIPGQKQRLVQILPVAAIILGEVVDHLGADGVTIAEWGLREGVALADAGMVDEAGLRAATVVA